MKKLTKFLSLSIFMITVFAMNMVVLADNQTITSNSTADIDVTATVGSEFTVGIPTEVVIDTQTNTGSYTISVAGSIDPRYRLDVTPTDADANIDGINFSIARQNVLTPDAIRIDVTDPKTGFLYNEFSTETPYEVECTLTAEDGAVFRSGLYSGVLTYNIELTLL